MVPFAVPYQSEMKGSYPNANPLPSGSARFADAVLTLSRRTSDSPDALLDEGTKFSTPMSREQSGVLRKYSLQMPCLSGFQAVRGKEAAIQNAGDLMVIATAYDGSQYLLYTLPNTTTFAVDDQVMTAGTFSVKVELQSRSGLIRLT